MSKKKSENYVYVDFFSKHKGHGNIISKLVCGIGFNERNNRNDLMGNLYGETLSEKFIREIVAVNIENRDNPSVAYAEHDHKMRFIISGWLICEFPMFDAEAAIERFHELERMPHSDCMLVRAAYYVIHKNDLETMHGV